MSKNLESEYKNLMNDQIPDLWDRIESRLGPQQAFTDDSKDPVSPSAPERPDLKVVSSANTASGNTGAPGQTGIRPPRRRTYRWIIGVAAAAACVCIAVPMALRFGNITGTQASMAAADAAYEDTESMAMEPVTDDVQGAVPNISQAKEEAYYEEEAAAEEAYEAPLYEEAAAAEEYAEAEAAEEMYDAEEGFAAGEMADEISYLYDVKFSVDEISEDDKAAGCIYATILSCPDDTALNGETIVIETADKEVTGIEEPAALPAEAGAYQGDLIRYIDSDGNETYMLLYLW